MNGKIFKLLKNKSWELISTFKDYILFAIFLTTSKTFSIDFLYTNSFFEWGNFIVGPIEAIFKFGNLSLKIAHSNPAWIASKDAFLSKVL